MNQIDSDNKQGKVNQDYRKTRGEGYLGLKRNYRGLGRDY